MINDTIILTKRIIRNHFKMPFYLFLSLLQPLMYLLLFGSLFSDIDQLKSSAGSSYITFLTPGMVILSAMYGSSYIGLGLLEDINKDFFDRLVVSAVSRNAILMSYVTGNFFPIFLQTVILVTAGMIFGYFPQGGILGLLMVLYVAILVSISFGSLSIALSFLTNRLEPIIGIMNFFTLPLMFTSTMMIPEKLMPAWIKLVARYNPISWAADIARGAYTNLWSMQLKYSLICLTLFSALSIFIMTLAFKSYMRAR